MEKYRKAFPHENIMEFCVNVREQPEINERGFWIGPFQTPSAAIEAAKKEMHQSIIFAVAEMWVFEGWDEDGDMQVSGNPIESISVDGHVHADIEKIRRQCRDALNKTANIEAVLQVAERLNVLRI